jgi:hypothetical protein
LSVPLQPACATRQSDSEYYERENGNTGFNRSDIYAIPLASVVPKAWKPRNSGETGKAKTPT